MSRIIFPTDFTQQRTLLANIITKNAAEPMVLQAFLTQQNIDLAANASASTAAKQHDDSRLLLSRQSENNRQMRDLKLSPVMEQVRGCVQFLKVSYKPNYKELGSWGIPINDNGKVTYPSAFPELAKIFDALYAKHNTYPPGDSPLQAYLTKNNIDLANSDAAVLAAKTFNKQFLQTAKDSENETQLRNNLWVPVNAQMHSIGDFLKSLYDENPKALGMWGFVVDDSTAKPKERISTLKAGEKITTAGIVLGSTLTNIGTVDIHLYKGKSTAGNPAIIHAGESFGILKGYSAVTVSNPSTLQSARFKVMVVK